MGLCPRGGKVVNKTHRWEYKPMDMEAEDYQAGEFVCVQCSLRGNECLTCGGEGCRVCEGQGVVPLPAAATS
jgi:hypothetical protein